jgi:hypothetical protein
MRRPLCTRLELWHQGSGLRVLYMLLGPIPMCDGAVTKLCTSPRIRSPSWGHGLPPAAGMASSKRPWPRPRKQLARLSAPAPVYTCAPCVTVQQSLWHGKQLVRIRRKLCWQLADALTAHDSNSTVDRCRPCLLGGHIIQRECPHSGDPQYGVHRNIWLIIFASNTVQEAVSGGHPAVMLRSGMLRPCGRTCRPAQLLSSHVHVHCQSSVKAWSSEAVRWSVPRCHQ